MMLRIFSTHRIITNVLYYTFLYPFIIYYKFLCNCSIEGESNINEYLDKGFIIAANHSSYLDWVVLYLYFLYRYNLKVSFLAKEKVLDHFFWGPITKKGNCIRVTNQGRLSEPYTGKNPFINQRHIVIFPEGTRTPQGQFIKAKTGVVKISVQQNLPIIPTGLIGFFDAWPRHRIFPKSHKITIRFGKAYYPFLKEVNKRGLEKETRKVMSSVGKLIGEDYQF